MARKINRKWIEGITAALAAKELVDETLTFPAAAKWLVATLSVRGVPYRILNLGAGVKRITTTDAKVCTACKGTGFSDG